jgi:hypothetical protein
MNKRYLSIILVLLFVGVVTAGIALFVFPYDPGLPDYAMIKISEGGGCVSYFQWDVILEKNKDDIKLEYIEIFNEKTLKETNISIEEFQIFWKELKTLNFKKLKDEYIVPEDRTGWRSGYITFKYKVNKKEYFKEVKFTDGVDNKRFKSVYTLLKDLKEKIPPLDEEKMFYYVKNANYYSSLDYNNEERQKYQTGIYKFNSEVFKGNYYFEIKEFLTGDYPIETKNICLNLLHFYKQEDEKEEIFLIVESLFNDFLDENEELYNINIDKIIVYIKKYKEDNSIEFFKPYLVKLKNYVKNEKESTQNRYNLINLIKQILPGECDVKPVQGPCKAVIYKYYYNHNDQICDEFLWGGCDGVVPFETLEDCQMICE